MSGTLWRFTALDTLFFRDGQPMNMGESAWIDSRFPPTGVTMQGAIRAAVLDHLRADIGAFQRGEPCLPNGGSLKERMGDAGGIGALRLTGPFLHHRGEPWLPAPLDLVRTGGGSYELLRPADEATGCDLGLLRLPRRESDRGRSDPLGGLYLSRSALTRLLRGRAHIQAGESLPLLASGREQPGLADREPKVGLARNNRTRTHRESMLYSIAPVRPRQGVELRVAVAGLEPEWYPSSPFPCLLGGEKRAARVHVTDDGFQWPAPSMGEANGRLRFKMVFLTPVRLSATPSPGTPAWVPEQFEHRKNGFDHWHGVLNGAEFDIVCAVVGRPERIGGWNLKEGGARELHPYLPAGSVIFCEADPNQRTQVAGLHDTRIGDKAEYGFGHLLIGQW